MQILYHLSEYYIPSRNMELLQTHVYVYVKWCNKDAQSVTYTRDLVSN
jgi:hypothetical protein